MMSAGLTGGGGAGANDVLASVIQLIANDPTGFQAKIAEFTEAEAKAKEAIALVGKAGEIPRLHEEARQAAQQATFDAMEAKVAADKLIGDAEAKAAEILSMAAAAREEIEGEVSRLKQSLADLNAMVETTRKQLSKEIQAHNAKLAEERAALDTERAHLHDALARAGATENAALEMKAKFEDKMARISAVAME